MNQTPPPVYGYSPRQQSTSGFAIASLVLGILGLLCFSIFTAIPAVIFGHLAISRIKNSGNAMGGQGLAVAGLVTGYLAILAGLFIIPAIVIPNFVKARNAAQMNECLNHLQQIDAAKNQWALEHHQRTGVLPTTQDLQPYLKNFPTCPGGGAYTIGPVGDDPTCSILAHRLSQFSGGGQVSLPAPARSTVTAAAAPPQAAASHAVGFFISALNRADMVHESKSNILYVTAADSVLRYQLDSRKFLSPWVLGGDLRGLDLSPDNKFLAVADAAGGNGRIGIHLVDLQSGNDSIASFSADTQESGTFSVAFGADGQVWVSSSLKGSGFVPLRKYNPPTRSVQKLQMVGQDTMLSASADRQNIAFAQANNSSGPYGKILYRAVQVPPKPLHADKFLFEIGISRDGTQLAVPAYDSLILAGSSVPRLDEQQIIGAAFHPLQDYLFLAQAGTSLLTVYETSNYSKVKELDFGEPFERVNQAFQTGRLRLSQDGKFIFCTVNGGIRCAETGL